ncbi:MAG: ComEC/Rec2 family competence protein [Arcobacteraceae bacterium]
MEKSNIKLLYGRKDWILFLSFLAFIALINLKNHYDTFIQFKYNELFHTQGTVVNIYPKDNFNVLKLQTPHFDFFTSVSLAEPLERFDHVSVMIVSNRTNFFEYLKGFYAPSINVYKISHLENSKTALSKFVANQHSLPLFQELYNALFFAIPISKELRDICANFGISHLIAISGFHLGVIAFVVYWLCYYPYSYFHSRYFSYRNKKFDILLLTVCILFVYLLFTSIVPSFLRAFVMFCLGLFFLRSHIKLFSFETLLIATLLILALFPTYVFSISLWFSIAGVFYIFLYLEYFRHLPKVGQFFLFNAWIYLAMNPITNFFFGTTSYLQLFSSVLTLIFTLFYPIIAVLHLIGYGGIFDQYLLKMFQLNAYSSEVLTPFWFFVVYLLFSLWAIKKKAVFIVLNVMLVGFTGYIFYINSTHY